MSVKIRLARHGKKMFAYYHIVIADSRAPRDGKFIERIGTYNPNTNPATINIEFDKAMDWLNKGAQPTETVRAILSYKGILMKRHLLKGVQKGAFSEEEAEKRFQDWMKQKEGKIEAKRDRLAKEKEDYIRKRIEHEVKVSETRAQEMMKKTSDLGEDVQQDHDKEMPAASVEEIRKEAPVNEQESETVTEEIQESDDMLVEETTEDVSSGVEPSAGKQKEESAEVPVETEETLSVESEEKQKQVTAEEESAAEPAGEGPDEQTQEAVSKTEGEEIDDSAKGKEPPAKPEEDTKEVISK